MARQNFFAGLYFAQTMRIREANPIRDRNPIICLSNVSILAGIIDQYFSRYEIKCIHLYCFFLQYIIVKLEIWIPTIQNFDTQKLFINNALKMIYK